MSTIKSYSVGNGDMFYINHNSDSFTIIDCCLSDENGANIMKDIKNAQDGKGIVRFISTHPDEDHLLGLKYLDAGFGLRNFYCIKNNVTKEDESDDFKHYCKLRDSQHAYFIYRAVKRKWLSAGDDERGTAGIRIEWPIVDNSDYKEALDLAESGESPNNISAPCGVHMSGVRWLENRFPPVRALLERCDLICPDLPKVL